MGPAYPVLDLQPGETQVERVRAAGHAISGRMRGGRLYLTNKRLIWQPSSFARRVQGYSKVELPLSEIETVDIPKRLWTPTVGGTRRRIRLRMRDGGEQFFMLTMDGMRKYAEKLRALTGEVQGPPA